MTLVVCHANKWRSVIAEAALRHFGVSDVQSAGVNLATRGPAAAPVRAWIHAALGQDVTAHRARPVTAAMLAHAPIILYMDGGNLRRLLALGAPVERLRCLASYIGEMRIPDPAFRRAQLPAIAERIVEACRVYAASR